MMLLLPCKVVVVEKLVVVEVVEVGLVEGAVVHVMTSVVVVRGIIVVKGSGGQTQSSMSRPE